jgi:hypothetical protein
LPASARAAAVGHPDESACFPPDFASIEAAPPVCQKQAARKLEIAS